MGDIMVIDPDSQHFLARGTVKVDDRDWKTVDIGLGQPISIEAWAVTDYDRAVRMLRGLVRREAPIRTT